MTASLNKKWFKEEMGNSVEHEQGKQDSQKPGAKLSAQYDSWWAIDRQMSEEINLPDLD